MADPRFQLSAQDLRYAATALRLEAILTEQRAEQPEYGSTRRLFKDAAAHKKALANRLERIAEMVAAIERPICPSGL
jgi:hypothetical protein